MKFFTGKVMPTPIRDKVVGARTPMGNYMKLVFSNDDEKEIFRSTCGIFSVDAVVKRVGKRNFNWKYFRYYFQEWWIWTEKDLHKKRWLRIMATAMKITARMAQMTSFRALLSLIVLFFMDWLTLHNLKIYEFLQTNHQTDNDLIT